MTETHEEPFKFTAETAKWDPVVAVVSHDGEVRFSPNAVESMEAELGTHWRESRLREVESKVAALADSPDVTAEVEHLRESLAELRGALEARPTEPADLGTVDPPERPWWARSAKHAEKAESISTLRYMCADSIPHKPGDVVYDKVSGAGPFVLFSPAVGFSEEDGSNRSGQVHVWDGRNYKRLPAVALTATNPNPPTPTWRIATYALAAAAANSALWWYLGSAGLL